MSDNEIKEIPHECLICGHGMDGSEEYDDICNDCAVDEGLLEN